MKRSFSGQRKYNISDEKPTQLDKSGCEGLPELISAGEETFLVEEVE